MDDKRIFIAECNRLGIESIELKKDKEKNCKRIKKFPDCPKSPTAETCKGRCSSWF